MKFDPTKPVQTRDGRKVRILCTDKKHDHYPIVGIIQPALKDEQEVVESFTELGMYYCDGDKSRNDLINIPEKHVRYININKIAHVHHMHDYTTKEDAEKFCSDNRIACIRIEYEDGQFDD